MGKVLFQELFEDQEERVRNQLQNLLKRNGRIECDEVLSLAGSRGLYQQRLCLIICLIWLFQGVGLYQLPFIFQSPMLICQELIDEVPLPGQQMNIHDQQMPILLKKQLSIHQIIISPKLAQTEIPKKERFYDCWESEQSCQRNEIVEGGFDSLTQEQSLFCTNMNKRVIILACFFVGSAFGAAISQVILHGNSLGPAVVFRISLAIEGVSVLSFAVISYSYEIYCFVLFMCGLAGTSTFNSTLQLLRDYCSKEIFHHYRSVLFLTNAATQMTIISFFFTLVKDWRKEILLLVGVPLSFLAAVIPFFLIESPMHLLKLGNSDYLYWVLTKIAAVNQTKCFFTKAEFNLIFDKMIQGNTLQVQLKDDPHNLRRDNHSVNEEIEEEEHKSGGIMGVSAFDINSQHKHQEQFSNGIHMNLPLPNKEELINAINGEYYQSKGSNHSHNISLHSHNMEMISNHEQQTVHLQQNPEISFRFQPPPDHEPRPSNIDMSFSQISKQTIQQQNQIHMEKISNQNIKSNLYQHQKSQIASHPSIKNSSLNENRNQGFDALNINLQNQSHPLPQGYSLHSSQNNQNQIGWNNSYVENNVCEQSEESGNVMQWKYLIRVIEYVVAAIVFQSMYFIFFFDIEKIGLVISANIFLLGFSEFVAILAQDKLLDLYTPRYTIQQTLFISGVLSATIFLMKQSDNVGKESLINPRNIAEYILIGLLRFFSISGNSLIIRRCKQNEENSSLRDRAWKAISIFGALGMLIPPSLLLISRDIYSSFLLLGVIGAISSFFISHL